MSEISNKDSEQDVKIAVIDSTLENATRRMELIHKRIDRTDERVTKLNEDVRAVSYTHLTLPTSDLV